MVGRLLGPKNKFLGFKGTISTIWRMKSGLSIQDIGNRFVFQFGRENKHNKILHGGPWFYGNTMLVLRSYDGIGLVAKIPLNSVETWVAVKGLLVGLRNKAALTLGRVIQLDQTALHRKEKEQRVKLVLDVRRRVRVWKLFEFSLVVVTVELFFTYEKVRGFCLNCGFFEHGEAGCDVLLTREKDDILAQMQALTLASLSLKDKQTNPTAMRDD
ncbi:uncharacterized protein LOC112198752 [Rosa chinensis]|uniref:uncharacterized protein LOC112198752 n=1 Tax=Rosa chinensis TaxID=74649 RepID=UPI000D08E752|nr:uncharacterized protein LOC112198752 [Rosa chinensis]